MKLVKRRSPMSWRTRWHRWREAISWWCWRKWRGQSRWTSATFSITDKELAGYPRATGKSEAGVKACGHFHDAVDYDELNREHDAAALKCLSEAVDAEILRNFMDEDTEQREIRVGEAIERGLLPGHTFEHGGRRFRVVSTDDEGIDAVPVDQDLESRRSQHPVAESSPVK